MDPKSIVCEFFRRGQCAKGFKCKYSHDLNVERKGEKIDLYSDKRDGKNACISYVSHLLQGCISNRDIGVVFFTATMEDWDQETLEKVVESKGQEYIQNKPTEIVLIFDKPLFISFLYFLSGNQIICIVTY